MTEIDLAELNSREAARFSLAGLEQARTRSHQVLVLLLGGGTGLGAFGLDRMQSVFELGLAASMASAWWFWEAGRIARLALPSSPIRAWAQAGLLTKYQEWEAFNRELGQEGKPLIDPLVELRKSSVRATDRAAEEFRDASTVAFSVLDSAYRRLAFTPLVAAGGALLAHLAMRWL